MPAARFHHSRGSRPRCRRSVCLLLCLAGIRDAERADTDREHSKYAEYTATLIFRHLEHQPRATFVRCRVWPSATSVAAHECQLAHRVVVIGPHTECPSAAQHRPPRRTLRPVSRNGAPFTTAARCLFPSGRYYTSIDQHVFALYPRHAPLIDGVTLETHRTRTRRASYKSLLRLNRMPRGSHRRHLRPSHPPSTVILAVPSFRGLDDDPDPTLVMPPNRSAFLASATRTLGTAMIIGVYLAFCRSCRSFRGDGRASTSFHIVVTRSPWRSLAADARLVREKKSGCILDSDQVTAAQGGPMNGALHKDLQYRHRTVFAATNLFRGT
ncbi:hypothetical protein C8R43DRAFT_503978 [Mycena crocata]|nr:hypothetical protein C8R43DRAFT_503978 [Mycena crocata]